MADLNRLYKDEPALHELDFDPAGFEWIDCTDSQQNVLSLMRKVRSSDEMLIIICNFTPVPRFGYRVGVPRAGLWRELLNSDSLDSGGSDHGNLEGVKAETISAHGRSYSINLTLPPLSSVYFKREGARHKKKYPI